MLLYGNDEKKNFFWRNRIYEKRYRDLLLPYCEFTTTARKLSKNGHDGVKIFKKRGQCVRDGSSEEERKA